MDDLRARLATRVQLTTDGHRAYLEAVEGAFGGDIDYAQLIKMYGEPTLRDMEWLVSLIDSRTPTPKKHGPYRKRAS